MKDVNDLRNLLQTKDVEIKVLAEMDTATEEWGMCHLYRVNVYVKQKPPDLSVHVSENMIVEDHFGGQ